MILDTNILVGNKTKIKIKCICKHNEDSKLIPRKSFSS